MLKFVHDCTLFNCICPFDLRYFYYSALECPFKSGPKAQSNGKVSHFPQFWLNRKTTNLVFYVGHEKTQMQPTSYAFPYVLRWRQHLPDPPIIIFQNAKDGEVSPENGSSAHLEWIFTCCTHVCITVQIVLTSMAFLVWNRFKTLKTNHLCPVISKWTKKHH